MIRLYPFLFLWFAFTSHAFTQTRLSAEDMANFRLSGDAYMSGGNCFRLTEAMDWSGGSIWYRDAIDLKEPFAMELNLMLGCKDRDGADGMVFIFHPYAMMTGRPGEGMGYSGLRPSLGIELDTWENEHLGDPPQDHIAILSNGSPAHWYNLAGPVKLPNLEDCRPHRIYVKWDPGYDLLSIAVDGVERIRYQGDIIQDAFDGISEVYWGVSAATGRYNNRQEICFEKLEFARVNAIARLSPGQITQLKKDDGLLFERVRFPSGQTSLTGETTGELDKLVRYLNQNTEYAIEIAAHTDASGSEAGNLSISQARADAIKRYLINKGVEAKRIYAFGYGEASPIATNATPEGRSKNRRIAFSIFRIVP
jgi:outer membrane protein OmpA-like peptidoglycan-associated protein